VLIGRLIFSEINQWTVMKLDIPTSYINPIVVSRSELPTHDTYSYFAGLSFICCLISLLYKLYIIQRKCFGLRRRNAVRRSRNGRGSISSEPIADGTYWERRGKLLLIQSWKATYLIFVVGLVLPLLVGLSFNNLIMAPINAIFNRTPIVFYLLDWSTGAIGLRIFYNMAMMNPNARFVVLANQARADGLVGMRLTSLSLEVFLPIILCTLLFLCAPFIAHVTELVFGISLNNNRT
jgi:hypothetical protein